MKIYCVEFTGVYPVPCGLVLAAKDMKEAKALAAQTIRHTPVFTIREVDISQPGVIFYESGDY